MTNPGKHIVFFVPEWPALDGHILHSQVLSPAHFLSKNGYKCTFFGTETSAQRSKKATKLIKEKYGITAYIYPHVRYPNNAFGMMITSFKTYFYARKNLVGTDVNFIYFRSIWHGGIVRKLANLSRSESIFDVRGAIAEEAYMKKHSRFLRMTLRLIVKYQTLKADKISVVSNNLKSYIAKLSNRHDSFVVPCYYSRKNFSFDAISRLEMRRLYSFEEKDMVICYSGGVSAWQRIDDILKMLKKCIELDSSVKVMLLTLHVDQMQQKLDAIKFPKKQYILKSVVHGLVSKYLSAADAGIIMREDVTVNNVASPIKVGEYLACGLPIILTKGIGDYSTSLPEAGIALLLNDGSEKIDVDAKTIINYLRNPNFKNIKMRCENYAKQHLSIESNIEKYQKLFGCNKINQKTAQ